MAGLIHLWLIGAISLVLLVAEWIDLPLILSHRELGFLAGGMALWSGLAAVLVQEVRWVDEKLVRQLGKLKLNLGWISFAWAFLFIVPLVYGFHDPWAYYPDSDFWQVDLVLFLMATWGVVAATYSTIQLKKLGFLSGFHAPLPFSESKKRNFIARVSLVDGRWRLEEIIDAATKSELQEKLRFEPRNDNLDTVRQEVVHAVKTALRFSLEPSDHFHIHGALALKMFDGSITTTELIEFSLSSDIGWTERAFISSNKERENKSKKPSTAQSSERDSTSPGIEGTAQDDKSKSQESDEDIRNARIEEQPSMMDSDPELFNAVLREIIEADVPRFEMDSIDLEAAETATDIGTFLRGFPNAMRDGESTKQLILEAGKGLARLPLSTPGLAIDFGIEHRSGSAELEEMVYISIEINEREVKVSRGGSVYDSRYGSDSYSSVLWWISLDGDYEAPGSLEDIQRSIEKYLEQGAEIFATDNR